VLILVDRIDLDTQITGTFNAADVAAQALGDGWDLVSITSQTESDYIKTLLATHTRSPKRRSFLDRTKDE